METNMLLPNFGPVIVTSFIFCQIVLSENPHDQKINELNSNYGKVVEKTDSAHDFQALIQLIQNNQTKLETIPEMMHQDHSSDHVNG